MKKLLREPLLHFLIFGAALFLVTRLTGGSSAERPDQIVVTPGQVERLVESWRLTWQRPPTPRELEGLIEDYIREEVLYREALAMGLDQDDAIVRRRLRQKMEFLTDDLVEAIAPTDEELQQFLKEHAVEFRVDVQLSFTHVYLNRDRRGEAALEDAERLLTELNRGRRGSNPSRLGDPLPLLNTFNRVSETEVASRFGRVFAEGIRSLEPGRWRGPVESGFGLHLVLISERIEGRVPELAEVKDAVLREWSVARRNQASDEFYRRLRARYTVVIEQPSQAGETDKLGEAGR